LVGDAVTAVSDAVGAVRSIVIVVADVAAVAGPVLPAPSLAPPAACSLAVWCLRDALEAAFNAGVEQGRKTATSDKANN
jgi:hypothetical protein